MIVTRENYREYDAVNYSTLSKLRKHPSLLDLDEEREYGDGVRFGSLVDTLALEPHEFDNRYYVNDVEDPPSGTARKLADWIYENKELEVDGKYINYVGNEKITEGDGERLKNLWDLVDEAKKAIGSSTNFKQYRGVEYLRGLIAGQDKEVISESEHKDALNAALSLKSHAFSRKFFIQDVNTTNLYQVPMVMDWNGTLVKSLLDIVHIDHINKVIHPVDLKCTSRSPSVFPREFIRWGYYIQASLYSHQAYYWMNKKYPEYNNYYSKDLSDYTICLKYPFKFLLVPKMSTNTPYIFRVSDYQITKGKKGGNVGDREHPGWEQLINDLKWHREKNIWNYRKDVYQNNGRIDINVFD